LPPTFQEGQVGAAKSLLDLNLVTNFTACRGFICAAANYDEGLQEIGPDAGFITAMKLHIITATILLYSLLATALIALSDSGEYWTLFP
jgi:hypothetical protein